MNKYHTILFISRNKDNKHLEGFKERSKTFLSDKTATEVNEQFLEFSNEGIKGELSRFYRSVNSRDIKKANTKLVHYLIDNPEFPPHKLQTKLVSLASQKECAAESKWLFDYDDKVSGLMDFVVSVEGALGDGSEIRVRPTVRAHAIVVEHGFDTRKILERWKEVSLHRDGQLLENYEIKS